MRPRSRISLMLICASFFVSTPGLAGQLRTQIGEGPAGAASELRIASEEDPGAGERKEPAPPLLDGSGDATLLWHRHHEDAIYTSTGIAESPGLSFAGNSFLDPVQVEAVPLEGDGTPDWVYGGTNLFSDASRNGEVLAAVDFNDADSIATVMQWDPDSSTPLWSYEIYPCRSLVYQGWASRKPIQVSDDGSTIALGITMWGAGGASEGRLYVFDAGDPAPAVIYDLPSGSITAVAVTALGEYVALASWPTVYVYDRYGETLRWSGAIGAGNDALAISSDGHYLAWGWTTFYLREWTGASYAPLWTYDRPGTYYVAQCAFSGGGDLLALAWDNGSTEPNEVYVDLYELPSVGFLWEHDYGATPVVGHVDGPSQMIFSNGSDHFAIASWGGAFPEVHVFEPESSAPIFTLDTPGSMFDVDLVGTQRGVLYLTACGKDVHAGTGGSGGDSYAVEIPVSTSGAPAVGLSASSRVVTASPSPFRQSTRIGFSLAEAGPVRLAVYDAAGRLVKRLVDQARGAGLHSVAWNGRSEKDRRMAPGLYLVRLEAKSGTATGKIVLAP